MGFFAVFRRETLLLCKKIGNMGYILSSTISPFIYLFAFGLGLGKRVEVAGGYLPFLAGGIITISILMNSFQQTASSTSSGRVYYRIFQNLVLSPVSDAAVMLGIVATGMLRGLTIGSLIFLMAHFVFGAAHFSFTLFLGAILGSFCFAAVGAIIGLSVHQPDDIPFVTNAVIMPMIFFGGTFFPIDSLPKFLQYIIAVFPIGAMNRIIRSGGWRDDLWPDAVLLFVLGLVFFLISIMIYRRYSE